MHSGRAPQTCGCTPDSISASTIGFMLAPRINAAGRMGQIDLAVELFLTDDPARAVEVAKALCELNRQRQELAGEMQEASDARQWTEAIKACANLTELDAITLNRLVKVIIVHERIDEEGTRHISVEIHFNLKPLPEATEAIAV